METPSHDEKRLLSREPWWLNPPKPGQDIMSLKWIYLEFYSDGDVKIGEGQPTPDEIRNRKSCRLVDFDA